MKANDANRPAGVHPLGETELKELRRGLLLGGATGFLTLYLTRRFEARWHKLAPRQIPVVSPMPEPGAQTPVPVVLLNSRNRRYLQRWCLD